MLNGFTGGHGGGAEVATARQETNDTGGQSRGREIFIVDDDLVAQDVLTKVFHRAGYQVTSFVDGTSFAIAAKIHFLREIHELVFVFIVSLSQEKIGQAALPDFSPVRILKTSPAEPRQSSR